MNDKVPNARSDLIPGSSAQDPRETAAESPNPLPTAEMREQFLARVRALSSSTEVHIPVALRGRHAGILGNLLDRIGDSDRDACFLEEIRSKLLLSIVPRNRNTRVEFSLRLDLWREKRLEELLVRIECQRNGRMNASPKLAKNKDRGNRAKHLIREGALSRGVLSLVSDVAELSEADEVAFADELLPSSEDPVAALFGGSFNAPDSDVDAGGGADAVSNLQGIRFIPLSLLLALPARGRSTTVNYFLVVIRERHSHSGVAF